MKSGQDTAKPISYVLSEETGGTDGGGAGKPGDEHGRDQGDTVTACCNRKDDDESEGLTL